MPTLQTPRSQFAVPAPPPSPEAATSDSLRTPGKVRSLPSSLEASSPSSHPSQDSGAFQKAPEETRPYVISAQPIQPQRPRQFSFERARRESVPDESVSELPSFLTPASEASTAVPSPGKIEPSQRPGLTREIPSLPISGIHPARSANSQERSGPASTLNQSSEPSIRVTIGKVEVRAIFPPAPVNRTPPRAPRRTLSLDDFLKRNSGAGR